MRKTGICLKCSHNQLLYVGAVADTGEFASEIRPMRLAVILTGRGLFGAEKLGRAGQLSAVVCKSCGYTEFYVLDPESIKPDGEYVHEINGAGPSATPHR
jgi:predicted nucleic-acid-binding Zn-ribbon protein